jgi:hypothetical protein
MLSNNCFGFILRELAMWPTSKDSRMSDFPFFPIGFLSIGHNAYTTDVMQVYLREPLQCASYRKPHADLQLLPLTSSAGAGSFLSLAIL